MSKQNQLAVTGLSNYTVALISDAIQQRQALLETASLIVNISTPEEQQQAVEATAGLKSWAKTVEKSREELKAPLLEAGRLLDSTAKQAQEPVTQEVKRIEGLLADFHCSQEVIRQEAISQQQEAERKAREEQERQERAERERVAEIERQRVAAATAALEAKTLKARQAAAAEAQRLSELQEAEELAKEFAAPEVAEVYVPPPTVVKPQGASVKRVIRFEVTDIHALLAAHPQCVELVPRAQQINYLLNTPGLDLNSVPGLRAWEDTAVAVRSAGPKPAALSY